MSFSLSLSNATLGKQRTLARAPALKMGLMKWKATFKM